MEELPKGIIRCTLKKSESMARKIITHLLHIVIGIIAILILYGISLTSLWEPFISLLSYVIVNFCKDIVILIELVPWGSIFAIIKYIGESVPWIYLYVIEIIIAFFLYAFLWCLYRDLKGFHPSITIMTTIGLFIGIIAGLLNWIMINITLIPSINSILLLPMVLSFYISIGYGMTTGCFIGAYIDKRIGEIFHR